MNDVIYWCIILQNTIGIGSLVDFCVDGLKIPHHRRFAVCSGYYVSDSFFALGLFQMHPIFFSIKTNGTEVSEKERYTKCASRKATRHPLN